MKDAVLLWHLRYRECITHELDWRAYVQDSLLYYHPRAGGVAPNPYDGASTLHVDDTVVAASDAQLDALQKGLENRFGPIKRHQVQFKHVGVDFTQKSADSDITMDQTAYIATLNEVDLQKVRGDGRLADSPLNASKTTDYRSLACGIAWAGVTSPSGQCAGSLYQTYLPHPTIAHARMLNTCLRQLRETYTPLVFKRCLFRGGQKLRLLMAVSYTHLTLPTKRRV